MGRGENGEGKVEKGGDEGEEDKGGKTKRGKYMGKEK